MSRLDEAERSILRCEEQLRRLVADAGSKGEYAEVLDLTALAQAIARVRASRHSGGGSKGMLAEPKRSTATGAQATPDQGEGLSPGPTLPVVPIQRSDQASVDPRTYPVFRRIGDDLVKIGWSAKQKAEYQHRASHALLVKVVTALSHIHRRKHLRIVDLQKMCAAAPRDLPPLYQLYVVVAWLSQIGAMQQVGRQGYAVADAVNLPAVTEEAWQRLEREASEVR